MLMVPVGMKPATTIDEQGNALDERTPQAKQAGISILWPIQKQPTLSPTIEESPSPRVAAPKPGRGNKTASSIVDGFTKKAYPVSSDARPGGVHGSSYGTNSGRQEGGGLRHNRHPNHPYSEIPLYLCRV